MESHHIMWCHRGTRTCMKNIPDLIRRTPHASQMFTDTAHLRCAAGSEQPPLAAHALVKIAACRLAPVNPAPSAADQMSAGVDVERVAGASRWSVRPLSRAQASKTRAREAQRLGTGRAARSSARDVVSGWERGLFHAVAEPEAAGL